jgi:hypothetical protein
METNQNKKYLSTSGLIILILSLLLVGIGGFLLYDYKVAQIEEKYTPEPIIQHDTIIRDSIQIKEKIKWKYATTYDTVIVVDKEIITDTITVTVQYSTNIQLHIDHLQYTDTIKKDSSECRIQIDYSGYKPSLDNVLIDYSYTPKTIIQPKKNGWGQFVGVGIQIGYGPSINAKDGTFVTGPYIGVGVTYGFGYHF